MKKQSDSFAAWVRFALTEIGELVIPAQGPRAEALGVQIRRIAARAGIPITVSLRNSMIRARRVDEGQKRYPRGPAAPEVMQRAHECVELYKSGLVLEEIGVQYGITRERVRQLINKVDPQLIEMTKQRRIQENAEKWAAFRKTEQERFEREVAERPCRVCGTVFRPTKRQHGATCSELCSEALVLNPDIVRPDGHDRHRLHMARSILRHPEDKRDSQIIWAKRILEHYDKTGEVLPANRRYTVKGSKRSTVLKKALRTSGSANGDSLGNVEDIT